MIDSLFLCDFIIGYRNTSGDMTAELKTYRTNWKI